MLNPEALPHQHIDLRLLTDHLRLHSPTQIQSIATASQRGHRRNQVDRPRSGKPAYPDVVIGQIKGPALKAAQFWVDMYSNA